MYLGLEMLSLSLYALIAFNRHSGDAAEARRAVREAVLTVGRALVTTSAALALGFGALALSPWQSVASFGFVASLAIVAALVSTLLVLPALIQLRANGSSWKQPG